MKKKTADLSFDRDLKYRLYEASVQDPEGDVERFHTFFEQLTGRAPRVLREDFCGTFKISCAWIRKGPDHQALGLDLDPEPIESGRRRHLVQLTPDQQARLTILQQDVRSVTRPAADVAIAGNFSSYIFKTREDLLAYFKAARRSLAEDGILLLEIAGGPGMIEQTQDKRPVKKNDLPKFTYVWDQQRFDPITHDVFYAIHFELGKQGKGKGKLKMKEAFTYDWRLWTIPELRDVLLEAGFADTAVFWEGEDENGDGSGEYALAKQGTNDTTWLAYLAGLTQPAKSEAAPPKRARKKAAKNS